jgi:phosphoglycerol transferase MdoB-like AlkP superfamily enzyme
MRSLTGKLSQCETECSKAGTPAPKRVGWFGLSPAASGRLLSLALALTAIKMAVLSGLGKELCDTHWRTRTPEPSWINTAAFLLFIGLGVASLGLLGKECQKRGLKAVRTANATVLGLGLIFIFLTFHTGEKNYLYPILSRVLTWSSLGPYLSLDLCFRPPFLAGWIFGYVLTYYFLARTGRELWVLWLTTAVAGAYGLFNLKDLAAYSQELLLADVLGVLALLLAHFPTRTMHPAWLLVPAGWTIAFTWGTCHYLVYREIEPGAYFCIIVGSSIVLFGGTTILAFRHKYAPSWVRLLPFWFTAFLLLTNTHYPLAENYNHLIWLGIQTPRYFVGDLALVVILAAAVAVCGRFEPKVRLWWLDAIALSLILLAFIDLLVLRIMGFRLNYDLLTLAWGEGPRVITRMAQSYLSLAALGFGVVALLYHLAARGVQRWLCSEASSSGQPALAIRTAYVVSSLAFLAGLGLCAADPDKGEGQPALRLVQTSPLWQRTFSRMLCRDEFLRSADALGLKSAAVPAQQPATARGRELNVVFVFLESCYNQHLSLFGGEVETQPLLSKYKDRMEVFPNFFSVFQSSIHARFASFTSLYPTRDYRKFTLERVNVKSIFEVLHERGYTCSLFYSSTFGYTGFGDFLRERGIDEMYDADSMPGSRKVERISWGLLEEETLGAIQSQIKKYARTNQPFFLTYVPAAPHYPYDGLPSRFKHFNPGEYGDFTHKYHNELLYMDWVLASILDQLNESGLLDKTLVVITADHGELLGAKGGPIGHGWEVTPELANVPLIIMDPERPGYRINSVIGSQVDLLPTMLDLLHIPIPSGQLYQGRSIHDPEAALGRLVYINSFEQYGIISNDVIFLGDRQGPGAKDSPMQAAVIENRGTKTFFSKQTVPASTPLSIHRFDEFQENFLRHYGPYCRVMQEGRTESNLASSR